MPEKNNFGCFLYKINDVLKALEFGNQVVH